MAALAPRLYDAIVVGVGAAGVAALSRLTKAGLHVLGLEASSRRGGRVCTVKMGGAVELGAEWIHGEEGNAVFELSRHHNIPISQDYVLFNMRRSDGTLADEALCDNMFMYCWSCKDGAERNTKPIGEFVTEKFYDYVKDMPISSDKDFCKHFLNFVSLLYNNYDGTSDWNDLTLLGSEQFQEVDGHQHWSFGEKGYETILKLIEDDFRLNVRLNSEVTRISSKGNTVSVQCKDGTTYTTKHVIVTVSLGVLKARHSTLFGQPLPAPKLEAISKICMGVVDKIVLQYETVWWPNTRKFSGFIWKGDDLKKVDDWMGQIFGFSVPSGAKKCITLWTSGETAKKVERMSESDVLKGCKILLQMFMGPYIVVPDAIAIKRSLWHTNPYTLGSYSFRGAETDERPDLWSALAAPIEDLDGVPRILFAGEACSKNHYSTVHGAIETGVAAAMEVLQHTRSNNSKI